MIIEEIIRDKNKEFSFSHSEKSPFDREVFTRDSTQRKIKAAHYFAPLLREKFSSDFPSLDWEALAAELTVISKKGPDSVNYHFSFLYAVAIFILDSIYHSPDSKEKLNKLKEVLSDMNITRVVDEGAFDCFDEYFRDLGSHPIYPDEMIFRLSSLLAFRNADFISYRKEKSHHDSYSFIADIYTTSIDRSSWNGRERKIRDYYETVIALVDSLDIQDAVEEYEKILFDLIGRYIKCRERMRRKGERLDSRKEYLNFKMDEEILRDAEYNSEKENIMTSLVELEEELLTLKKAEDSLPDVFTLGLFSLIDVSNNYVTPLNGAPDCEPYKVVSAFFFLFDKGDERAWLLGPAMAVLGHASNRLPWADPVFIDEGRVRDELKEKALKDVPISPLFYSAVPGLNDISLPGASFAMTAAKYIYNAMNVIPSRYYPQVPDRKTLEEIMSDNLLFEFESSYRSSFSESHRLYYDPNRFSYTDYLNERIDEKESELKETKEKLEEAENNARRIEASRRAEKKEEKEIEVLKNKIDEMSQKLSREAQLLSKSAEEIRRLKKEHRLEKEELNSLRELIFSRDNTSSEEGDENQDGLDYPYQTEHEIIVIGGHSDWLKKMKSLLPAVRFYGDRVPDKEALKHTDVLWFQTYSGISHSAFYKTVDILKNLDVAIKYCPTSGLYRSAAEIVNDDRERE